MLIKLRWVPNKAWVDLYKSERVWGGKGKAGNDLRMKYRCLYYSLPVGILTGSMSLENNFDILK